MHGAPPSPREYRREEATKPRSHGATKRRRGIPDSEHGCLALRGECRSCADLGGDEFARPLAFRAATIGTGMIGLAGIGAASILSGLDGRTKIEIPQKADIHAAWVASQSGSVAEAEAREHAQAGIERGAEQLRERDGAASGSASTDGGAARESGVTADGKVILNAASAGELTRLPGIGQRRAEAIVELRTRLKRFRRVQDLLRVKGIGPRSLKRLMPHMVLDEPAPAADAGK